MCLRTRRLCSVLHRRLLFGCRPCRCFRNTFCRHVTLVYLVTFGLVLPFLCRNLRSSSYFTRTNTTAYKQEMRDISNARVDEANAYLVKYNRTRSLASLQPVQTSHPQQNFDYDIAITIIATSRDRHKIDHYHPSYLTQVVWKFLTFLEEKEKDESKFPYSVKLSICNVDPDPATFSEAHKLEGKLDMFSRFNKTHLSIVHLLEKEKQDYVFCLNKSFELYRPRYAFLIEDDALPHDDLFTVLSHILRTRLDQSYRAGEFAAHDLDSVAYVKFYHPERVLGYWSLEPERLPELFGIGAIFGTILTLLYCRYVNPSADRRVVWLVLVLFTCRVVMSVGRVNLIALKRFFPPHLYTFGPAPSCCTPAMLYPRHGGEIIASYLTNTACKKSFGKDMAIERFMKTSALSAYIVQPNTFTHIGLYSSLRKNIVSPYDV